MKLRILATVAALAIPSFSYAAPFTFFGENLSPGGMVTGDPLTARTSFLGALSGGVGTEDFEGFSVGTGTPLDLSFNGSTGNITATLSGNGTDIDSNNAGDRFATSGSNFVETPGGGDFDINFSTGISAFGFYGTDLGDIGNDLVITLRNSVTSVLTSFTLDLMGSPSGSLMFWGFTDTTESYDRIAFSNTPGTGDVFGFDDMTVGDTAQIINPPTVPLPAAGWMLIAGLGAMGAIRRRQRKA